MKESEIRPKNIFYEYLKLSRADANQFFGNSFSEEINCIACDNEDKKFEFEKDNFKYFLCNYCKTLFQSPRPTEEAFEKFYNNSKSSKYWSQIFFPTVAEVRRNKIFKPRVNKISEMYLNKNGSIPSTVVDVGAGYGIFLEEWIKKFPSSDGLAIEPSEDLAKVCINKNIKTINKTAEQAYDDKKLKNYADLVVCFEVLEHVRDPLNFIKVLKSFLSENGQLLITTLCSSGFDIQLLWENSNSISPPHHINFFSIKGFKHLFNRAGFSNVEVQTPGLLDVDIVKNYMKNNTLNKNTERFMQQITREEKIEINFQNFLIHNNLSSHCWVMAKT